jgi:hypothetical protein
LKPLSSLRKPKALVLAELHARGIEKRLQAIEPLAREITGNKKLDADPYVFSRGFARLNKELGIPDSVAMMNGRWKSVKVYNRYGNDFTDLEANKLWDSATPNLFKDKVVLNEFVQIDK